MILIFWKTTYIKLMDVWMVFGLVLPFIAFLLTIIEEILKSKEKHQEQILYSFNVVKTVFQELYNLNFSFLVRKTVWSPKHH